jgi:hypothetical protein
MKHLFVILGLFAAAASWAQSYSVTSHTIGGGGGTSTNAQFSATGTIGQPDAGAAMTNGQFSATSGFWSLVSVIQAPDVPNLSITRTGPNSIQLLWPDAATNTFTLQQNANLGTTNWVTSAFAVNSANGTNTVTVLPPVGRLFFRLKR